MGPYNCFLAEEDLKHNNPCNAYILHKNQLVTNGLVDMALTLEKFIPH